MAAHDVLILNEVAVQIQEIQAGDTYNLPADTAIGGDLTITGTVDGRDVAADGGVLDTAVQPGDNVSDLVNDAGYEANVALADQAEAEAGVENTKTITALRVAQAIVAQGLTHKFNAVVDPAVTDDNTLGYTVGSVWINVTADLAFICVDATTNVAVWLPLGMTAEQRATLDQITGLTDGITAYAGGGQADAVELTTRYNIVDTVATGGDSVKLPEPTAGQMIVVKNVGASSMDLFPASGGKIDKNATDAAEAVAADTAVFLFASTTTQWDTL